MKIKALTVALTALLTSVAFTGQSRSTIVETAVGNDDFSTLVDLVKAADLVDVLNSKGPWTVFAPNNDAFAKVPKETVDALMADKDMLKSVLLYHVVPGNHMASDVVGWNGKMAITASKNDYGDKRGFRVKVQDGTVMVDNAKVIATDIKCSNGVVHVIDSVIVPEM